MKTREKFKMFYYVTLIFVLMCVIVPSKFAISQDIQYRQLTLKEYKDKVEGGWLGQAIGVLWGQWTENVWQGKIVPFDLEDWYRPHPDIEEKIRAIKDRNERREFSVNVLSNKENWMIWNPECMSDQDDLYIEFMYLHSIQKYGLDVTAVEVAEDWVKYLDPNRIWCANKGAYRNFMRGIWPPMSGNPRYTSWSDAIDYQIEADLFGLISPGLPRISNAWGDKIGHIMNYGNGVYAGMAMSAMYSMAFFESNPLKLVEYSLQAIPSESGYAKMVRDVLDFHHRYPDWKDAWDRLERKYGRKDGKLVIPADVVINGAYVYMGLLYGEGDFWKTMNISMRCGRDSDCNPSSSVGILSTVIGLKGIPEKWSVLRDLPIENRAIKEIYPNMINWDAIIASTIEVGKWNIIENGGYLENGIFYIPYQTPTSPPLEQTIWEEIPGNK